VGREKEGGGGGKAIIQLSDGGEEEKISKREAEESRSGLKSHGKQLLRPSEIYRINTEGRGGTSKGG